MKGRVSVYGFIVVLLLVIFSTAGADTILFPVIASNPPNVVTIVSVANRVGSDSFLCLPPGCASGPSFLKYTYRYKDTLASLAPGLPPVPNHMGSCYTTSFVRPTVDRDLVSFDVSGTFNGGNALFNDPNSYGGGFAIPATGAKRGYLLVSHSWSEGTRRDSGDNTSLYGEAILMDIVGGAAWGYVAVNDKNREDYNFTHDGTASALDQKLKPSGLVYDRRSFTFFPPGAPESWKTRFFVTPIGDNMDTTDYGGYIGISSGKGLAVNTIKSGVYDRGGNVVGSTLTNSLVCTAAMDLLTFLDATAQAAVQNTGGWGYLYNNYLDNPVIVYKLEYVFASPTYGGTNNNGYCLSCTPY